MSASSTSTLVDGLRSFVNPSTRIRRAIGAALVIPSLAIGGLWATGTVTVADGDTLSAIAAAHGVRVADLAAVNGIEDPDLVIAGQVLTIPTPGVSTSYAVRPGDTLSAIAVRFRTTVAALAAANGISDVNLIVAGQRLEVSPGATSEPSTTAPAAAPAPAATPGSVPSTTSTTSTTSAPSATGATAPTTPPTTPPTTAPAPTTAPPSFQSGVSSGAPTVMTYYVVRTGDTLASVSSRFGITTMRLAESNGLTEASSLTVGAVLYIPGV